MYKNISIYTKQYSTRIGLIIYQKQRNMSIHKKTHNQCKEIKIGGYMFEKVSSFSCLVSIINGDNSISEEIKLLSQAK
jgi:hypothetical protein